jgi:hypothetical protein
MSSTVLTPPVGVAHRVPARSSRGTVSLAVGTVAAVAVVAGAAMRVWYLCHRPVTSDETIAGLMARQILHGHFWAFYWGQSYGGVEPYVMSGAFAVFGSSVWVLRAVPVLLAAAAAVMTWRVTRRLVGDSALAVLAGGVVWATPDSAVANSSIEWGFRAVAMVCGLGMVLLSLRILDGDRRWWAYGVLGLVSGIGWWSSPEIAYFVVPALLLLGGAAVQEYRARGKRQVLVRLLAAFACAVIGALPWLWNNVQTSFHSLSPSGFEVPPGSPGYGQRLNLFFHNLVAMLVSLRNPFTGSWLGGKAIAFPMLAFLLGALALSLVLCVARRGRSAAIAVAVLTFPFLLAESPATWYWLTGRYVSYVVPLYVMVLAIGAAVCGRWLAARRSGRLRLLGRESDAGRIGFVAVSAILIATTLASFVRLPMPGRRLLVGWGDPNAPTAEAIRLLERAGITDGYANYWVAYRLDFLSHNRLKLTVGKGQFDRWPSLDREVASNKSSAWIFVKPSATADRQFGDRSGPGGLLEALLIDDLRRTRVGYRTVGAGLLEAIIPARPVSARDYWPPS